MYKITRTIKQHTPIIHFQYDQHGATLRGTEVKPALDKFLIDIFKTKEINYDDWLIGDEKKALNYRISFQFSGEYSYYLPTTNSSFNKKSLKNNGRKGNDEVEKRLLKEFGFKIEPLYSTPFFANEDKVKFEGQEDILTIQNDKLDLAVFSKANVDLKIQSFNSALLEKINAIIDSFFFQTSFGKRKNKGFGSFTVINKEVDQSKLECLFDYKLEVGSNLRSQFETINLEYQLLKSGKNRPKYFKSELFKYFIHQKKPVRWEKRWIKQQINKNYNNVKLYCEKDPIDYNNTSGKYYNSYDDKIDNQNYGFVRALLGLSDRYEFITDKNEKKDFTNKLIVSTKHVEDKEKKNLKIQRFASPLHFKIINGYCYLRLIDIPKDYEGTTFEFSCKYKKNSKVLGTLDIPENFNLKDFLKTHLSHWEAIKK